MGLLSKIGKGFKKLGRSIASGMRKIGRGVKKVFKKVAGVFGKFGPLGHLAMFFILPGISQTMLNFMGNFGQAVGRFLPKGFTNTFADFGKAMVNGAKGIYNGTVGRVFETVTGAMKNGLDILSQTVTGKTQGGWGSDLSEWFKNFNENGFGKGPTAAETIQGDLNIPTSLPEAAPPGIFDEGYKLPAEAAPPGIFDEGYKIPKADYTLPKGETILSKQEKPGWFKASVDKRKDWAKKDFIGTGVSVGETASLAKDGAMVIAAGSALLSDPDTGAFYNPNIDDANALLTQTNDFTLTNSQANIQSFGIPQNNSLNNLIAQWNMLYGINNSDLNTAYNTPGYGTSFIDYATVASANT